MGLRADVVANGQEAIDALENIPCDLVFMDVQMAEMDGLCATKRIRSQESEIRSQEQNFEESTSPLQVSGLPHETGAPSGEFHRGLSPHPSRRTPVIAMTVCAMQQDRDQCFVVGMDDYLAKPINPVELVRVLENWLLEDRGQRGEILCMVLAFL